MKYVAISITNDKDTNGRMVVSDSEKPIKEYAAKYPDTIILSGTDLKFHVLEVIHSELREMGGK